MAEGGRPNNTIDIRKQNSDSIQPQTYIISDKTGGMYTNIQNASNVQLNGKMVVNMGRGFTKEKVRAKKPVTTSNDPLTLDQMLDIKDRLGSDWRDLGRRLKYDEGELKQLHVEYKDEMQELNYQILFRWGQRQPENATQSNLAKIFIQMQRGDLADLLAEDRN